MSEQVKTKIELNKVTHSVRAAQAVLQYGVGAMVDFPDQTLVTAAPEYWSGMSRIYDDRFAKALGVDYFALPTNIAYSRFPEWYAERYHALFLIRWLQFPFCHTNKHSICQ